MVAVSEFDAFFPFSCSRNSHFLFFRLHGLLCERLTIIRDKSIEILNEHKRNENNDLCGEQSAAVTLGMKSILGEFFRPTIKNNHFY